MGFCFSNCFAQSQVDSLHHTLTIEKEDTNKVNTFNMLSENLWRIGNYDTSLIYSGKAEMLAEKLNFKRGMAAAFRHKGLVYYYRGDFDKALEWDFKALTINKEIGNRNGIASNYGNIGNIFDDQGNYPKALDYEIQALQINKELGNKYGIASNLCNIGIIYYEQLNYPKALEYDFTALPIYKEIGNKLGIAIDLANIGIIYGEEGNDSNALEYDMDALAGYKEIDNKNGVSSTYGNIGSIYFSEKNYDKALEYWRKSLTLKREMGAKEGIAVNLCNIGNTYLKLKKYSQAKVFLDSAVSISMSIGAKIFLKDTYLFLSQMDSVNNDYKKETEDYKKYIIYRDSLINEANTRKTVQAQMNYDFDQKQAAEKAEQDKKDALAKQEIKKQNIIRDAFIAGFALTLILAFFIYRGYRQKQSANAIITQQKEEVETQKTLVEAKNKDILDSITYAKQLQDAILPPISLIKKHLPESFVFYKPKDIVAGDFYWMEKVDETVLIAAADCTGHGVPGALVSIVCSNALNRAVKEFKIKEPGKILDKVREIVVETFSQRHMLTEKKWEIQDGMDISLIAISPGNPEPSVNNLNIQWSGANNALWYIMQNEIREIPPDKQPIGIYDKSKPFTTHTLRVQKGDTLYLFTDGYADQFGGPNGKKFMAKQLSEKLNEIGDKTMEEQKKILEQIFMDWKGSLYQVDDVLIIGIKV
jgi:tetratricopeptide (TPR) repeat protein